MHSEVLSGDESGAPARESESPLIDDLFWRLALSGLVALERGNTWVATRRLDELVTGWLAPLLDGAGEGSQRWRGVVACDVSELPHALTSTADAYRAVIDAYQSAQGDATSARSVEPVASACESLLARIAALRLEQTEPIITLARLSVALPAFNEEAMIAETVNSCIVTLSEICPNFEVIVVDDGSLDRTGAIADAIARSDASVRCVHNRPNRGYGGALRAGFDHADGDWLFFMDSDGQFDIRDIARFLRVERDAPGVAVLGYRARRSDRFMRKVNAWGWKRATRAIIGLSGIRDVDCAFKLFPTNAIRDCELRSTGAAVSAEFLRKFQRMRMSLVQLPVTHLPRTKGSPTGARVSVIIRAFEELLILRKSLRTWHAPNHAGPAVAR